ncbi:unnamed protein product [Prorocentrum cordatum]|uniref:P-type ATPase N-terminal domain-containing protein n=1 Tax=Prorocentrum cordatum TaxID=2364126 RepID=A0ABN9TR82_9DINO|nr:unnamed protein product [Polarella glacialis]
MALHGDVDTNAVATPPRIRGSEARTAEKDTRRQRADGDEFLCLGGDAASDGIRNNVDADKDAQLEDIEQAKADMATSVQRTIGTLVRAATRAACASVCPDKRLFGGKIKGCISVDGSSTISVAPSPSNEPPTAKRAKESTISVAPSPNNEPPTVKRAKANIIKVGLGKGRLMESSERTSKGTAYSDSGLFARAVGRSGKTEKWSYLFRRGSSSRFKPADTGSMKGDDRKISVSNDGVEVFPRGLNRIKAGEPNTLRTTRFTLLTWIPLSLMHQFRRVANVYFLFICVIVVFPWSPKTWHSKLGPFFLVLLWTACKDLYEDLRRRRDDRAENSQVVRRLVKGKNGAQDRFEDITWNKVLVGDVLFIMKDDPFPADTLLLHPAGGTECFISTVMLDGETSLKERSAPSVFEAISRECGNQSGKWLTMQAEAETWAAEPKGVEDGADGRKDSDRITTMTPRTRIRDTTATAGTVLEEVGRDFTELEAEIHGYLSMISTLGLDVKLAAPTPTLHDVRGAVHMMGEDDVSSSATNVCPFGEINFLPRGCILRNTPWVIGIAGYVGDDTKVRMNAIGAA